MKYQIVGLAGTFASGKDTLAKYLEENYGVTHVSTGDLVRKVAMELYGSIEREVLAKTATQCRAEYGAGYFVERAVESGDRPIIISGVRSLGEMNAVKAAGGFIVYVDADVENRYQRMQSRARDDETQKTLEEFIEGEKRELYGNGDVNDMANFNLAEIGKQADVVIMNNESVESFIAECENFFELKK